MKCIYCSHKETSVINTRPTQGFTIVWRRRQCEKCHMIFTTREGTFTDNLFLIKRNEKRVRFIYEKLFTSIFTVLNFGKERDNGDQAILAKEIAYRVIDRLREKVTTTFLTKDIIIYTYQELIHINPHAADSYMLYSEYRRAVLKKVSTKK